MKRIGGTKIITTKLFYKLDDEIYYKVKFNVKLEIYYTISIIPMISLNIH